MKKGGDPHATMKSRRYKRMSLIIDPKLHRAFKVATMLQGTEMSQVLIQFIEQYVEKYAPANLRPAQKGGRA